MFDSTVVWRKDKQVHVVNMISFFLFFQMELGELGYLSESQCIVLLHGQHQSQRTPPLTSITKPNHTARLTLTARVAMSGLCHPCPVCNEAILSSSPLSNPSCSPFSLPSFNRAPTMPLDGAGFSRAPCRTCSRPFLCFWLSQSQLSPNSTALGFPARNKALLALSAPRPLPGPPRLHSVFEMPKEIGADGSNNVYASQGN